MSKWEGHLPYHVMQVHRTLVILLTAVLLSGCAARTLEWHRHYEEVMGLDPVPVREVEEIIVGCEHKAGRVTWDPTIGRLGIEYVPVVEYIPGAGKKMARHETCHLRMQHHRLIGIMSYDQMHVEVKACMEAYEKK